VNSPGTNPQATVRMFGRYVHASVQIPCICSLNITLWVVLRRVLQDFLTNPVVMHGGPDYHFLFLLCLQVHGSPDSQRAA
jgi:hypothetical protein